MSSPICFADLHHLTRSLAVERTVVWSARQFGLFSDYDGMLVRALTHALRVALQTPSDATYFVPRPLPHAARVLPACFFRSILFLSAVNTVNQPSRLKTYCRDARCCCATEGARMPQGSARTSWRVGRSSSARSARSRGCKRLCEKAAWHDFHLSILTAPLSKDLALACCIYAKRSWHL